MSVVESGIVRPGRDVPGELSLVSRGEEVLEVADMKLDHSETKTFKNLNYFPPKIYAKSIFSFSKSV